MRYAPTTGYVRPFEKPPRFRPLRGRGVGVCDTPLQPGTCEGSKNGSVFATVGGVRWAYAIRPYNRIRVILRNTDAIPQLGTCCPSKKCLVFVPFGAVYGAYTIRPYNRVRARVQKMDLYTPPSVAYGGAYLIRPYNRVCVPFEIPMQFLDWVRMALQKTVSFSSLSGPSVGRIRYAPTTGYVRSFKIMMQHPDRLCAILQNTDAISRPEGRGRLGGGAVGATVCGGGGRE